MRLLKLEADGNFSLTEFVGDAVQRYAILSHTWGEDWEEVTFKDLVKGRADKKAGYEKIRFLTARAAQDGLRYSWVDTCCINKSSSVELSEAINSMFQWYRKAVKCYVYLSDVSAHDCGTNDQISQSQVETALRKSKWFTRGWTLQELIAPASVEFFSLEGELLGDKKSLERQIHERTGIPAQVLQGVPLSRYPVDERMSWAAKRETKRKEDEAYCLFGIFDICMPLLYGEGKEKAFIRLREEIDKRSFGKGDGNAEAPQIPFKRGDGNAGAPQIQSHKSRFSNSEMATHISSPKVSRFATTPNARQLILREVPLRVSPDSTTIAVMGRTGAGKSSFITQVSDDPVMVGHGLRTCTTEVKLYPATLPDGKRLFLVDTLAFDGTFQTRTEVLEAMADWLGKMYRSNMKLTGIVYLQRISDARMDDSAIHSLRVFEALCGGEALPSVILATTAWSEVELQLAAHREAELKATPEFWGEMIKKGCMVRRLDGGRESVVATISDLIENRRPITLQLQWELCEQEKRLEETQAGQLNAYWK